jgi:hypothetical protein
MLYTTDTCYTRSGVTVAPFTDADEEERNVKKRPRVYHFSEAPEDATNVMGSLADVDSRFLFEWGASSLRRAIIYGAIPSEFRKLKFYVVGTHAHTDGHSG